MYPNWFEPYARPLFEKYLIPLAGRSGLRFLQIGAFTGDASLWMLRNVLTGDGSTLTDVDTWTGSGEPEHDLLDWTDVETVYNDRARGFIARNRLIKRKMTSAEFFRCYQRPYDFIYIDGSHDPDAVLADGDAALSLLTPGGLIAFDDYQWAPHGGGRGPAAAVNRLYFSRMKRTAVLEFSAQAWFQP